MHLRPAMNTGAVSQFVRFAQVGAVGFLVDWACFTLFLKLGAGLLIGRAISYLCAATSTWIMNRYWTFATTQSSLFRQWVMFLSANAFGGAINYATSIGVALAFASLVHAYPVIVIASGAIAGLGVNFALSRRYVFSTRVQPSTLE